MRQGLAKTQNPLNGRIESWDCLAGAHYGRVASPGGVEGKPETSGAAKTCGHAPEVTSKPLFRAVSGKPETEVWPSLTTSTVLTVAAPAT
jgi:hypothetical protein